MVDILDITFRQCCVTSIFSLLSTSSPNKLVANLISNRQFSYYVFKNMYISFTINLGQTVLVRGVSTSRRYRLGTLGTMSKWELECHAIITMYRYIEFVTYMAHICKIYKQYVFDHK
jgi:hypothetical protein